jgi:YkoY family integral membrane protein
MDFLHQILGPDLGKSLFTILNIVFIESLLSVDNAAVLATLVMVLPHHQRAKALRIGLVLAYFFRGLTLVLAGYLIKINWLKLAGGAYLLFLCIQFFYERYARRKNILDEAKEEVKELAPKKRILGLNLFWSTVITVESMDLVFSIDNVLAAVAYSNNLYIICIGVFIGIITMRLVAAYFVKLMRRFPFLDVSAFVVIGLLGIKLVYEYFNKAQSSHEGVADYLFSFGVLGIFILPILSSLLFQYPKSYKNN